MKEIFIKQKKKWLILTLILVFISMALIFIFGVRFSVDFKGGTVFEYSGTTREVILKDLPVQPYEVTNVGSNLKLFFDPLDDATTKSVGDKIAENDANAKRLSIETISSQVGIDQSKNAALSVLFASIGIIIFLTIVFREVPEPFSSWEFGGAAVLALMHDALIVVGVFAVLGKLFNAHIDLLFITAILTVIGFSVHDTIVVFDRVRENLAKYKNKSYEDIVAESLSETFVRSINLTLTAVLVLVAMLIWGPSGLKWFTTALLIGMVSGTYSSIFVATQLLLSWQDIKLKYFPKLIK